MQPAVSGGAKAEGFFKAVSTPCLQRNIRNKSDCWAHAACSATPGERQQQPYGRIGLP